MVPRTSGKLKEKHLLLSKVDKCLESLGWLNRVSNLLERIALLLILMNESDYLRNEGGQKEKFNENDCVR